MHLKTAKKKPRKCSKINEKICKYSSKVTKILLKSYGNDVQKCRLKTGIESQNLR